MKPTGQKNVIEIGPSRSLGRFLSATHFIGLIAVVYFTPRFPVTLILILPLLWSWWRGWSVHVALSSRSAVEKVEWGMDDGWILYQKQGAQSGAKLQQRNFVAPWMTLLSFSCSSGFFSRYVILLGDNCDADQLRRLRVRLRLNG
ncbi:MAG: hypothetical protein H6964_17710 [Chromatiaceae bacterium]|nr:hypothetical protein [Gammaproteobacteria bacterium]MCB1871382.1 hypothetical protein [Gammaproteobacteria bacterium]MCP5428296.1 hypothetical protein [Chromatiaceae bacterium]MCP5448816.1 hypothetical protein [Chromatiaceae bacterium]